MTTQYDVNTNERIGDRVTVTFAEAAQAAIASFGDAAEAQFSAAISTAIAYATGLRDGLPGVRRAKVALRAQYVAGRVGDAEGDLGAARAERARKAWSRHEARLDMALTALDRAQNPGAKHHSATRAIRGAYLISQSANLGYVELFRLFRDALIEVGIVDGISYAELTRAEKPKEEKAFDVDALVNRIIKTIDKAHGGPAQLRAVIEGLTAALVAGESADAAVRERLADVSDAMASDRGEGKTQNVA